MIFKFKAKNHVWRSPTTFSRIKKLNVNTQLCDGKLTVGVSKCSVVDRNKDRKGGNRWSLDGKGEIVPGSLADRFNNPLRVLSISCTPIHNVAPATTAAIKEIHTELSNNNNKIQTTNSNLQNGLDQQSVNMQNIEKMQMQIEALQNQLKKMSAGK